MKCTSLALLACAVLLTACGGGSSTEVKVSPSANALWAWALPAQYPEPRVPGDNPMSADKVQLGRFLFYDRRLSGNGTQACAGCHVQSLAFTDGKLTAIGSTGEAHPRNAQSIVNVAYNATLTWANPALTDLETQMLVPLFGTRPVEMGLNDANKATVLARLSSDTAYPAMFAQAFGSGADVVSWNNVIKAISAFQRSLISGNSKYDQYLAGKATLTATEERGLNLFFGEKAECFHCHGGFNFNDQVVHKTSRLAETPFHNTGLFNIGGTGAFPEPNRGVFELSAKPSDMGKFRAPSLRNVEVTAPYTHDGSIATLEAMLDFYAAGGRNIESGPHAGDGRLNPNKDPLVARISLDAQERADIVAFLRTLTDHEFLSNPKHADPFAKASGN
ncbi:MbnH family di-heme enzyme [Roseateles sp. PN1]|uniref:MbnH family di-heme enzyme n=1 Tax=Roseateles sp. PN1 TaxID=3137372 RepID=UPI003139ABE3